MTKRKYDSVTILYFSRAFEVKNSFFSKVLNLDIQPLCSIQSILEFGFSKCPVRELSLCILDQNKDRLVFKQLYPRYTILCCVCIFMHAVSFKLFMVQRRQYGLNSGGSWIRF